MKSSCRKIDPRRILIMFFFCDASFFLKLILYFFFKVFVIIQETSDSVPVAGIICDLVTPLNDKYFVVVLYYAIYDGNPASVRVVCLSRFSLKWPC